ncbi:MAG TPA: HIT domain-containing protein [Anaeromyxobacteraceae bacterium]|nr:HIT domain-containing protein [Anaeromyxobacteraceae bacterium]
MSDCLFCQIAAGEVPAEVVLESPGALAFLDAFPAARGHVLVIPRVHAESLLDLPDSSVGDLFLSVKATQAMVAKALRPLGMNVGWNHGRPCGQHVLHLHVHVLPRFADGGRGVQALGSGGDRSEMAALAAAIRSAQG